MTVAVIRACSATALHNSFPPPPSLHEEGPCHGVAQRLCAVEKRVEVGQEAVALQQGIAWGQHHIRAKGDWVLVLWGGNKSFLHHDLPLAMARRVSNYLTLWSVQLALHTDLTPMLTMGFEHKRVHVEGERAINPTTTSEGKQHPQILSILLLFSFQ